MSKTTKAPKMFAVSIYLSVMTTGRAPRRVDQVRHFAVLAGDTTTAIAKAVSVLVQGEYADRKPLDREDCPHTASEITHGVLTIA